VKADVKLYLTCNAPTYRIRDIRGQMAKIGVWEANNGPPEPLSWPRIWLPLKLSPPKGEKTCPDDSSIITQKFTPIRVTVAEISGAVQKVTQKERITAFVGYNNVLIRHYYYWRIVTFLIIAYLLTYLFIKAAFEAV